ncbi:MAG: restriction endonuclease subunit S, partial [Lentisphaeria bacterium]|nr:restriction endonuclease subunit S [Lentisphaeria bacterium]
SVRQSLAYKDFGLIRIIYPPHSIIEQFNRAYEPLLAGINHNLMENTKLAQLRDTLLPKLMSGEIDVSEVEI